MAPTAPTGVSAVSGNPTSANVAFNFATDNIGVAGYNVYRALPGGNPALAGTTAFPFFQDSGLTEGTTYTYTLQAFDLAGNLSPVTAPVNVTTVDTTPPTTPTNVVATAPACTRVTVTWSASQDNVQVKAYLVFMGLSPDSMTQAGSTGSALTYGNGAMSPATTYYFGIEAEDQDGNTSYMSKIVSVTTPALPAAPTKLTASPLSTTKISLAWSESTTGLPIAHYVVYRGLTCASLSQIVTLNTATTYTDSSLSPSTSYCYAVQATDSGLPPAQSGLSAPVTQSTYGPPQPPTNVTASPLSCTKVSLNWSAAVSGGLAIANYKIWRGATSNENLMTQIGTTTALTYTDQTVSANTTYYYAIQSADKAAPADLSVLSSPPVQVTTYNVPGIPPNFTATPVSSTKITLAWGSAPSGGLPVSTYHIYGGTSPGNLTQLAVYKVSPYNYANLKPNTTYYFEIQACDSANECSPVSPPISATTFPLPTTPSNVSAQGTSKTQMTVTWNPSSGNLAISRYSIFRGTSPSSLSQIGTSTSTTFTDRNLTSGTIYYYEIQAADTANDLSLVSSPAAPGTTQQ